MPSNDNAWHLDKKVPIALIGAMVMQLVVAVSWATTLSNDVASVKKDIAVLQASATANQSKFDALIELRGEIKGLVTSVTRLERHMDDMKDINERRTKAK